MTGLHKLTLADLQKKFTAGEVTACDIVQAYTLRINQVEPKVKAYITQTKDAAMAQAEERARAQAAKSHIWSAGSTGTRARAGRSKLPWPLAP